MASPPAGIKEATGQADEAIFANEVFFDKRDQSLYIPAYLAVVVKSLRNMKEEEETLDVLLTMVVRIQFKGIDEQLRQECLDKILLRVNDVPKQEATDLKSRDTNFAWKGDLAMITSRINLEKHLFTSSDKEKGYGQWGRFPFDHPAVGTRHALYSAGDVDAPVAVVPQGSRRRPPFHAPARCRTAMRASYWAQPALLSRGALARAAAAFRAGGTQSECRLFDVSHEGGLGVLLWSLGVESLGLPEPDAYLRDSRRPVWKSTRESTSAGCLKFDLLCLELGRLATRPPRGCVTERPPRTRPRTPSPRVLARRRRLRGFPHRRYLRGLPGAREFRRMRLQRPKHKPVAVHRVARGNDYPTAHAVRAALSSPEYTRIPATATVLRGAIPPRDVSPGAPFAPFRPEDCAPPSPLS